MEKNSEKKPVFEDKYSLLEALPEKFTWKEANNIAIRQKGKSKSFLYEAIQEYIYYKKLMRLDHGVYKKIRS